MASSAEEQSITPVPFRYRRDWLQGLVRNLIHLVLRLQVQQAGALPNAALIINDLKQKTSKDYNFSWGKALAHSLDAGVKLQHSRLTSLVEAAKVSLENSDVTSLGVHCPRACLSHCSL